MKFNEPQDDIIFLLSQKLQKKLKKSVTFFICIRKKYPNPKRKQG